MGVADNVRMHLDRQTGALQVFARKKVVEQVERCQAGDPAGGRPGRSTPPPSSTTRSSWSWRPQEFGRIAAQTAKQVILQRVRDAERDAIYSEFIDKEGKIVRGVVHRIEKRNVIVELGKAEGVILEREQIPGERYNPGDRVRAYVLEVKKTAKGPQIVLSRTHPGLLARLFEAEIPEIAEGIVQVKAAAREAGERAKVAVASTKRDVDPIGACVGLRGTRIQVISRELRGEKIDIVEWAPEPATFVARALSPAKVSSVTVTERVDESEQALGAGRGPRQPALAGHRQARPERAPGREADRDPRRHQERGRDRGGAPPRGGGARAGPRGPRWASPASARSWWTGSSRPASTRRPGSCAPGSRRCRRCRARGGQGGVDLRAAPSSGWSDHPVVARFAPVEPAIEEAIPRLAMRGRRASRRRSTR